MTKLTKAQKVKIIEGFNREVTHSDAQYKFRRGSLADRGGDIALRFKQVTSLNNAKGNASEIATISLENFNLALDLEAAIEVYFDANTSRIVNKTNDTLETELNLVKVIAANINA